MIAKEQEKLLLHLCDYSIADKDTCLMYLSEGGREKPDYGLRTLKRWGYVTQRKDGLYGITAKGLSHMGEDESWLTCGGNQDTRRRLATTSRVSALLTQQNIYSTHEIPQNDKPAFIPSQIWRNIRQGITSTARFNGMLFLGDKRLVVYHIGDGNMDWQLFAERSLFFHNYGRYDDRATGMLLICDNGVGQEVAENIIRNTMYRRKRLLSNPGGGFYETDKPQRYSRTPIRMHDQYSRAFLTEEQDLGKTLAEISQEDDIIRQLIEEYNAIKGGKNFWDFEIYPVRILINVANDLFKYLYLFSHIKESTVKSTIRWKMYIPNKYTQLIKPYRHEIDARPMI